MKIISLWALLIIIASSPAVCQEDIEAEFEAEYEKRIIKTRINGVYIPKDFEDAFLELERLSHPEDLRKFKEQPEEEVARKLHFGLGKWMMLNWSFYEGSRFSHYLKQRGLHFPDDMVQVTLRLFHRHLNDKPLEEDALIREYADRREEEYQRRLDSAETIEVRKRPRPQSDTLKNEKNPERQ
ncbi:MAG: DUF6794 domain-containing protein [Saprospiraceae bacterium]|nr:DUF6794 domain-containing protein [Saprospiraceae bacterium]